MFGVFFTIGIFALLNVGFQISGLKQMKFLCITGHFSAYTKAEKVAQLDNIIHIYRLKVTKYKIFINVLE